MLVSKGGESGCLWVRTALKTPVKANNCFLEAAIVSEECHRAGLAIKETLAIHSNLCKAAEFIQDSRKERETWKDPKNNQMSD